MDRTHLPKQAIISRLTHGWLLPKPVIVQLLKTEFSTRQQWQLKLPSRGTTATAEDKLGLVWANERVLDAFNCTPNILDPFEVAFTLSWQSEAPKYVSDLDIYVWQHYRKPPRSQTAYLIRLSTLDQRAQRLIVRLNTTAQMVKFKEYRCCTLPFSSSVHILEQWSANDELILSILAVCSLIVGDTSKFLEDVNEQLDYLVSFLSITRYYYYFGLTDP